MTLSRKELESLLRLVAHTADEEIDCEECQSRVAEFAERELADRPIRDGLLAVAQHLTVCGECREEYEVLQRALEKLES
jgi:hypothetical protein